MHDFIWSVKGIVILPIDLLHIPNLILKLYIFIPFLYELHIDSPSVARGLRYFSTQES